MCECVPRGPPTTTTAPLPHMPHTLHLPFQMVEEGVRVLQDLGALECLPPSAPFGAFDPDVWNDFALWLVGAGLMAPAGVTTGVTGGTCTLPSSGSLAGSSTGIRQAEAMRVQSEVREQRVQRLCLEGGGIWTNRYRYEV